MKYLSKIEKSYTASWVLFIEIPFTRTWTLKAFDENGDFLCQVDKHENNNYLKMIAFIQQVRSHDYDFTDEQLRELKSEPFISPKFIKLITKSHLIEVLERCGYNNNVLDTLNNASQEFKNKLAYDIGLTKDEATEYLDYYINNFT